LPQSIAASHQVPRRPPGAEPSPEPVAVKPIVALSVGACGSGAALRACDPLLPYLAAKYGVGLDAAAQTVTAFAIAYGVLQLAYGPIGDRYGKYRVIMLATIGCALTSIGCALAPTLLALVIARLLAGATAGALIPLSLAWIGDSVPYERRQSVLARYLIGQMFGIALGQVLGGIGADYLGAGPVFLVLAAWFAATAALMWHFRPSQSAVTHRDAGGVANRFMAVLRAPWSRVVLLTVFVEGLLLVGALAFVPTHLHRAYGLPLTLAASVAMLFGAGGLVYAALSATLVRRLGEAGLARGGGVLLAACFVGIAAGSTLLIAVAACLIAGLGFYMLHNTLQVNATQMAPDQRGSSLALFACTLFMGHAVGVTVAGVLAERVGTGPVIAGAGVLLLAVGLVFAAARQHRR
jgi:predicted MFS family arabinose efflux permease